MLDIIKKRLANREDSEHQQCLVRFTMGFAWLIYILWINNTQTSLHSAVIASAVIFLFAPFVCFLACVFDRLYLQVSYEAYLV